MRGSRIDALGACGVNTQGLVEIYPDGPCLQKATWEAFQQLQIAASQEGFSLRMESGWRSFEKQLSIWNRKATGAIPLLDERGTPVEVSRLDPEARMWMILNWSALPGTSRHHFGSDLDVVDEKAIPLGYEVNLTPQEVDPTGIFGPMHAWLDSRIQSESAFGFARPYVPGRGSIRPERWHISHVECAQPFEESFDSVILADILQKSQIELLTPIIANLDYIIKHYALAYFNSGTPS